MFISPTKTYKGRTLSYLQLQVPVSRKENIGASGCANLDFKMQLLSIDDILPNKRLAIIGVIK